MTDNRTLMLNNRKSSLHRELELRRKYGTGIDTADKAIAEVKRLQDEDPKSANEHDALREMKIELRELRDLLKKRLAAPGPSS